MKQENKENEIPRKIGTCPVCHVGQLTVQPLGYVCNHFHSQKDKCTFFISRTIHQKEITEEMARQLIEHGETDIIDGFKSKKGNVFSAKLVIRDKSVETVFDDTFINGKCPFCGGRIKETFNGYACEYYIEGNQCAFYIPKTMCNRRITKEEAERFIAGDKVILEGFVNNAGKVFSSMLALHDRFGVTLDSRICTCPKCGGDIHVGIKAFHCSNYRNEAVRCGFIVHRNVIHNGFTYPPTPDDIRQLCEKGTTRYLDFKDQQGNVRPAKLILTDDRERFYSVTSK